MGIWLKVNGEVIYEIYIWRFQNDIVISDVWYVFLVSEYCLIEESIQYRERVG